MGSGKIILKRSWTNKFGRKYPINQILTVDGDLGSSLIKEGVAEKYEGEYPPRSKKKMDLSNIK
jgi:hypothetical protein